MTAIGGRVPAVIRQPLERSAECTRYGPRYRSGPIWKKSEIAHSFGCPFRRILTLESIVAVQGRQAPNASHTGMQTMATTYVGSGESGIDPALTAGSALMTDVITSAYDFSAFSSLVDVGGNQ